MYLDLTQKTIEDIRNYFQERDYLIIAIAKEEPVRMYAVDATNTIRTAQRIHSTGVEETLVLGEAILSALLLTSLIKHATDQKVLLKLELQDGVVAVEADGKGRTRGFIQGDLRRPWKGTLTIVKELRLGVPYTGIVPIVGDTVKENLEFYLQQSEQIPTNLDMAVVLDERGTIVRAGGYMVQTLGGASQDVKTLIESRFKGVLPMEALLGKGYKPEDIVNYLMDGMNPRVIGLKEVEYYCPCNEEVAKASLMLMSEEELNDVLQEGPAEVHCRFCGRIYRFTREQVT